MSGGARLGSAVLFVRDLNRSAGFYEEILELRVTDRSPTAVLLTGDGAQLILRAVGGNAPHPLGAVGVQYVVWNASSADDLHRAEQALTQRQAHRVTRTSDGVTAVEGRDPDEIAVMITHPGPDEHPMTSLPSRIYGW